MTRKTICGNCGTKTKCVEYLIPKPANWVSDSAPGRIMLCELCQIFWRLEQGDFPITVHPRHLVQAMHWLQRKVSHRKPRKIEFKKGDKVWVRGGIGLGYDPAPIEVRYAYCEGRGLPATVRATLGLDRVELVIRKPDRFFHFFPNQKTFDFAIAHQCQLTPRLE